jgi:DNA polymerase-3 subunit delta'
MNWDMIGNEWAVQLLKQHILSKEIRHAYLFTGPPGVGRRTLALRFAQGINCPQPLSPGEPCRTCRTCIQIENMQHPDLSIVQLEEGNSFIRIEQIRTLQRELSLSPYEASFRIALLDDFQEANANAQNALLKTLEEAPPKVVLILTAEYSEALLPTIISRCEVLKLRPLPVVSVEENLCKHFGIPTEEAKLLAHLSSGRIGTAIAYHTHPELLEKRREWIKDLNTLLSANRCDRFAYAQSVTEIRGKDRGIIKENLCHLFEVWISYWRDALLCKAHADVPLVNYDERVAIQKTAEALDLKSLCQILTKLENSQTMIEENVNLRLIMEVFLLDLPRINNQSG